MLDKFYTKKDVASLCIKLIPNIDNYDIIVEPSAGNGSFSTQLKCISYDIEPEHHDIIKQDFLKLNVNFDGRVLFIGNPPFGPRSSLAKSFIRHCIELNATTIAFILPDTFNKLTNQSVFPEDWHLLLVYKLNDNNFMVDNEEYYVPCSFYVWTKDIVDKDLREKSVPQCKEFAFMKRGSLDADFAINGNNGKVKNIQDITNPKAEHYIYVQDRSQVKKIRSFFEQANYHFNSSVNGNNAWVGQQDILKYFYDNFY